MGLKGLLAEFLVAAVFHGVDLESVRVAIHKMVLSEQVRNRVEGRHDAQGHHQYDLGVGNLRVSQVRDVLSHVVSHLRGRGRSTIVILNHTVVQLRRHGDNHMIEVGIEVATFGHIQTKWRSVVVTSQQVVWVVGQTRLHITSFGQLGGPDSLIGSLSLMDSHVGRPDSVVNLTLTEIPLLEVVGAVLLMSGVNLGQVHHLGGEFVLPETLVYKQVVLLMHGAVTALASSRKHLETSSQSCGIVGVPCDVRWEVIVAMMHSHRVYLFFITFDTVWGTNVVTEEPSLVGNGLAGERVGSAASKQ